MKSLESKLFILFPPSWSYWVEVKVSLHTACSSSDATVYSLVCKWVPLKFSSQYKILAILLFLNSRISKFFICQEKERGAWRATTRSWKRKKQSPEKFGFFLTKYFELGRVGSQWSEALSNASRDRSKNCFAAIHCVTATGWVARSESLFLNYFCLCFMWSLWTKWAGITLTEW